MSIYTKKGDHGQTTDYQGRKLSKENLRAIVLGELDELNSSLGVVRAFLPNDPTAAKINQIIVGVQKIIMSISSETSGAELRLDESSVNNLEKIIDHYWQKLPPLKNFVIPGGSQSAASCHVSRAICRRAERSVVQLNAVEKLNPDILKFMNRLSDLLFTLTRAINQIEGHPDYTWKASATD